MPSPLCLSELTRLGGFMVTCCRSLCFQEAKTVLLWTTAAWIKPLPTKQTNKQTGKKFEQMSECGSFGNWFLQSIQLSQEVEKRSYVAVYQLKIMRLTADNKLQSGKCKHDTCTVRIVSYLNLLLKKRKKKVIHSLKCIFSKNSTILSRDV